MGISYEALKKRQGLSLGHKICLSKQRIKEWYEYWDGNVYVSFSGGKDSTVLLHIVRSVYPEVPAVFADTGLEYPEVRKFAKKETNLVILKPKITFLKSVRSCGFPVISKSLSQQLYEVRTTKSEKLRKNRLFGDKNGVGKIPKKWMFLLDAPFKISHTCCFHLKKQPFYAYEKKTKRKAIVGSLVEESNFRRMHYLVNGCNSFNTKRKVSNPMSFWYEEDIWEYIKL